LKDQPVDQKHFDSIQDLEKKVHDSMHNLQAAIMEHGDLETKNLSTSIFVIMVGNPTDSTNPMGKKIDIRGMVVDSNLEMNPDFTLKSPMNLTRLSIPLEQRLVYAIKHIWDQVGVKLLNESPPVALAGEPVEEGD